MVVVIVEGGLSDGRQHRLSNLCGETRLPSRPSCHHRHLKQPDFGNRRAENHERERLVSAFVQKHPFTRTVCLLSPSLSYASCGLTYSRFQSRPAHTPTIQGRFGCADPSQSDDGPSQPGGSAANRSPSPRGAAENRAVRLRAPSVPLDVD